MQYTERFDQLNKIFTMGEEKMLTNSEVDICFFKFHSIYNYPSFDNNSINFFSDNITENSNFNYVVFTPNKGIKQNNAILLLHGLNERSWRKYLTWAEYLCQKTSKVVILFPMAFHINRCPATWTNPREVKKQYDTRANMYGADKTLSFANIALSERITQYPSRFYNSGLQTINDLVQLLNEIKNGQHPIFNSNTKIDVFAYSIGALLAQVMFLSNPLFNESKLFMFCGGGIFSSMVGKTKLIMDIKAYDKLLAFYSTEFQNNITSYNEDVSIRKAFYSMISSERFRDERINYFKQMGDRLAGISLKKDRVIPYNGVNLALGNEVCDKQIQLLDFDFDYSHENPFPVSSIAIHEQVDSAFETVFKRVVDFFNG